MYDAAEEKDMNRSSKVLGVAVEMFLGVAEGSGRSDLVAEEFLVVGPSEPIVAVLGQDVALPCRVSPTMSVEDMELRWFRSKFSEAVFIYQNRQEQNEEQVSDNGLYTCSFRKGSLYKEATFELKVAGVGSAPAVRITGPEEDGVRVVCMASGWFPKPQVQWRDLRGGKFLAFSEAHAQDAEGLFSVEATLVVRDSSVGNVTCSLLNPVLGQEKAMAIFIPAPFFPQASPWKLAFQVSLTVLMILLLGAGCYTRREHATKLQEVAKKKRLCLDKEQDQREQEEARKEIAWRKAQLYAAWRKAQLYAVVCDDTDASVIGGGGVGCGRDSHIVGAGPVTLDPGSAHSDLVISHEMKSVAWKDCNNPSSDICSVLGFESIAAGRWYWEVEVRNGDRSEWALGVCREGVNRKGWQVPHKASFSGALFPYFMFISGDVSMTVCSTAGGSEGLPVPLNSSSLEEPASFSGALFPYFMLMSGDVSMTVCSTAGGSEGLPVPLNSSSLEEPVSLPEEGFCSGCGADAPPGVQSPLLPCSPGAASP
ncbi:butyrophilin subfamily 3 member A3 [Camelus ferus]|nr:butyrophilin subfamily 3 member A3 [Camelus ferus]